MTFSHFSSFAATEMQNEINFGHSCGPSAGVMASIKVFYGLVAAPSLQTARTGHRTHTGCTDSAPKCTRKISKPNQKKLWKIHFSFGAIIIFFFIRVSCQHKANQFARTQDKNKNKIWEETNFGLIVGQRDAEKLTTKKKGWNELSDWQRAFNGQNSLNQPINSSFRNSKIGEIKRFLLKPLMDGCLVMHDGSAMQFTKTQNERFNLPVWIIIKRNKNYDFIIAHLS
jgi:hypothetical protein